LPIDRIRPILGAGAISALVCALMLLVFDPTHGDMRRLDAMTEAAHQAPKLSGAQQISYAQDTDMLAQRPIFAMTTGTGAYKEKTFQLFGVSISPSRKAVLVSIDGAPPVWISVGQVSGDVQLIDADGRGARFDTPLGERTVIFSDPAPGAASAGGE